MREKLWKNPNVEEIEKAAKKAVDKGAGSVLGFVLSSFGGLSDPEYVKKVLTNLGYI